MQIELLYLKRTWKMLHVLTLNINTCYFRTRGNDVLKMAFLFWCLDDKAHYHKCFFFYIKSGFIYLFVI